MRTFKHLRSPFLILAGAGISYAAPSSLPKALDVMKAILDALPIDSGYRTELISATSPEWKEGIGYYHFLRFEQLAEALQLTIDPRLSLLRVALPPTEPNAYHYALAQLIKAGFPVMTTNFDTLIEQVGRKLDIRVSPIIDERDYEAFHQRPERFPYPLLKLHGSLADNGSTSKAAVDATLDAVITQLQTSPTKWSVINSVLTDFDLLVVGYSGSDDFDVVPVINYARGSRRLCWVNHCNHDQLKVFTGIDPPNSLLNHPNRKLSWFFNRMFLSFDYQFGQISRRPSDVMVIDCDTWTLISTILTGTGVLCAKESLRERNVPTRTDLEQIHSVIAEHPREGTLLAARVLQHLGRYETASRLLHRFLKHTGASRTLHVARAHLWIAQMMDERSFYVAASNHWDRAFELFELIDHLEWPDIAALQALGPSGRESRRLHSFLRSHAMQTERREQASLHSKSQRRWLLARQILANVRDMAARDQFAAAEAALDGIEPDDETLDLELRGDIMYHRALLRSARGNHEPSSGHLAEDAEWAGRLYEVLQKKSKWMDALIFAAEQDQPNWPDRAYENAHTAARIAEFIGNHFSYAYALRLEAQAAVVIRRIQASFSASGESYYRSVRDPEELERLAQLAEGQDERYSESSCCDC